MVWPWFSCGAVCLSAVTLSRQPRDILDFPIVPCHAFCMWHWPIGKDLDLSFIWGHHHLSEYMYVSRQAEYFIACCTVLTRPNKGETAVHGCNCWLSVWTLSCRCPVKLFFLHHCLRLLNISCIIYELTACIVNRFTTQDRRKADSSKTTALKTKQEKEIKLYVQENMGTVQRGRLQHLPSLKRKQQSKTENTGGLSKRQS